MNNKIFRLYSIFVIVLILPLVVLVNASSFQPIFPNPMIPVPSKALVACPPICLSVNWAGYAIVGPTGSVSDVKGSWTVPAYSGTTCNANEFWAADFWIGIDGFSSSTVEQTGTATVCYEAAVYYFAWYGFYPSGTVAISYAIYPGDVMSAEVRYASSKFTATLSDTTTGHAWSFAATKVVKGAKRSSAEWITESPSGVTPTGFDVGILPLADFGTVYFTSDTAVATIGSGSIGSFPSADVAIITAVCFPSTVPTKSTTSALTNGGANFEVTWLNQGPQG